MADANLAAYNAALLDTYTDKQMVDQLQQEDDILKWVETTEKHKVGNEARTVLHTGRNHGFTMLPAGGGTLNAAGNQQSTRAVWKYKNAHQQIAIEGETIDGTDDTSVAIAEVVETEVSGGLDDMHQQIVRQLYSDGTGVIAVCGTTTTANVVVLDPVTGWNAIERGELFIGALIDIGTAASATAVAAGRTITAITESSTAPTITIDGATVSTTATTHRIAYKGSRGSNTSNEMNGLKNVISTGDVLGTLDGATENTWNAADVNDAAGAPLNLPMMYRAQRKVKQRTGKGVDLVLSSYLQEEAFYSLLQAQAQFSGDTGLEAGNVESAKFAGMRVKGDLHCHNEDMHFLSKRHIFQLANGKPYWQNKVTGGNVLSHIQGTDSYGAKLTYRLNLGTNRRNAHSRIKGLAVPTGG